MLAARMAQVYGADAVAELLHLPAPRRRYQRRVSADARAAADAFQEYMRQLPDGPERNWLPSQAQLKAAGRHDLIYVLQVR